MNTELLKTLQKIVDLHNEVSSKQEEIQKLLWSTGIRDMLNKKDYYNNEVQEQRKLVRELNLQIEFKRKTVNEITEHIKVLRAERREVNSPPTVHHDPTLVKARVKKVEKVLEPWKAYPKPYVYGEGKCKKCSILTGEYMHLQSEEDTSICKYCSKKQSSNYAQT
jgi:chromosome segregation ATPase